MAHDYYYMVEIEEYDANAEIPWRTECQGLFESYRHASMFLLDEGLEVYAEESHFSDDTHDLYFAVGEYEKDEQYVGYIRKYNVIKEEL